MRTIPIIGVDIGGTKVSAGLVVGNKVVKEARRLIPKKGSQEEVLLEVIDAIEEVYVQEISGIGIGVPSVVDVDKGIVYDVQNIPSWEEVYLKDLIEKKLGIDTYINNDANCFALGERYYGLGQEYNNFIGLIVGTGMAAGIIINGKIYNGQNCGAGEFGTIPYRDQTFEYYCSGQFFQNVYQRDGGEVYEKAIQGDSVAISLFREMGNHLGQAIKTILYALDPELIILGGSVSKAYPLYKESVWKSIEEIAFRTIPERLQIRVSENPDLPVLGAAALCLNAEFKDS